MVTLRPSLETIPSMAFAILMSSTTSGGALTFIWYFVVNIWYLLLSIYNLVFGHSEKLFLYCIKVQKLK